MNWSIDFAPMLPTPFFWAAGALAVVLIGYLLYRRSRGALLRAAAIAAVLAALANPTLREEQRESLANVAIVIVDESASQTLGDRKAQTAAVKADLEAKLGKIPNLTVKWVSASRPGDMTSPGTHLFADLNKALADTPPDRLAGVVMITDGEVHDVPKSAAALGFDAPVHALVTGAPDEFDRRIEVLSAPRYGIVGQSREIEVAVREAGKKAGRGRPAAHLERAPRRPRRRADHHDGERAGQDRDALPARRAEHSRSGPRHRSGRADTRQQSRRHCRRGRAREPARAARLR